MSARRSGGPIETVNDILTRIRFFTICAIVAATIWAAQSYSQDRDRMNRREVYPAIDPQLIHRLLTLHADVSPDADPQRSEHIN